MTILIADLTDPSHPFHGLSEDYAIRSVSKNDIPRLAALYFASYDPGVACSTWEAALVDIRALFAYDYGMLRPKAPPVVVCDGEIVAALITVHRAAWSDTPNWPFIIELFTDCAPRRCGWGRALLVACFTAVPNGGGASSALQVEADNHPAWSLLHPWGLGRGQEQLSSECGFSLPPSLPIELRITA